MNVIKNLGYRTDCIFHEQNGFVEEKRDYFVIRTPSNPGFWFGNLILFKEPPRKGDLLPWTEIHRSEFGEGLDHLTFGWDSEARGAMEEFIEAGFGVENCVALTMADYSPAGRINPDLEIRTLAEEHEWRAATELDIRTGLEGRFGEGYRAFKERQMVGYRNMKAQGCGDWWGAFLGNKMVGSLGLFFDRERTVGRFQNVATDSAHRRRGVCTTLLDRASRRAFEQAGVRELVINTGDDEQNPAKKVYRAAGFVECMKSFGLTRSKIRASGNGSCRDGAGGKALAEDR